MAFVRVEKCNSFMDGSVPYKLNCCITQAKSKLFCFCHVPLVVIILTSHDCLHWELPLLLFFPKCGMVGGATSERRILCIMKQRGCLSAEDRSVQCGRSSSQDVTSESVRG